MTTKTLVPNIFERVFSFFTHMGQLSFDETSLSGAQAASMVQYDIVNSTLEPSMKCFSLSEPSDTTNSIANDLNVQIFVDCEVISPFGSS